jgi:hypothetical protein
MSNDAKGPAPGESMLTDAGNDIPHILMARTAIPNMMLL